MLGSQLTGSRKAFINFNSDLLKRKLPLVLNPKTTVVEILEDVEVDETMVEYLPGVERGRLRHRPR